VLTISNEGTCPAPVRSRRCRPRWTGFCDWPYRSTVGCARKGKQRHEENPQVGLLLSGPKARSHERWSGHKTGLTDTAGRVGSSRVGQL